MGGVGGGDKGALDVCDGLYVAGVYDEVIEGAGREGVGRGEEVGELGGGTSESCCCVAIFESAGESCRCATAGCAEKGEGWLCSCGGHAGGVVDWRLGSAELGEVCVFSVEILKAFEDYELKELVCYEGGN